MVPSLGRPTILHIAALHYRLRVGQQDLANAWLGHPDRDHHIARLEPQQPQTCSHGSSKNKDQERFPEEVVLGEDADMEVRILIFLVLLWHHREEMPFTSKERLETSYFQGVGAPRRRNSSSPLRRISSLARHAAASHGMRTQSYPS